jgi:hypothetical protein
MHLAYLDDSDTRAKVRKWQVMCGAIIEDKAFKLIEAGMSGIPQELIPSDRLEGFEEFHACELYGGYGVFEGIEQKARFDAITRLLGIINALDVIIVYGAVDLDKLKTELVASADPMDICFRICLEGLNKWNDDSRQIEINKELKGDWSDSEKVHRAVYDRIMHDLIIVILDDCDNKIKANLTRTFRNVRPSSLKGNYDIHCLHDDLYFGDSRFSIGIQVADLCSYFIARHLDGDIEVGGFFKMIQGKIAYGRHYPSGEIIPAPLPLLDNLSLMQQLGSGNDDSRTVLQASDENDPASRSEGSESSG